MDTSYLHIGELSNGLKVVHLEKKSTVAYCGLFINAGTRDELDHESGLAHFIEHALFKGTKHRKAFHILNRMDSVGGEIDAYTTKEMTCLYSTFLQPYFERAIELIFDISYQSTFPEKELLKEKEVIYDEINLYKDSPAELIYDDFEAQIYKGHALGNPILGTFESLKRLKREDILHFTSRLYQPENMVFSSVGDISFKKLLRYLNKYFGQLPSSSPQFQREVLTVNTAEVVKVDKAIFQSHCIIGKDSYHLNHPKRLTMVLLNNILGGPGLNSMLNLKIREKYGFTYSIESNYTAYSDTGIFSVYLGTDPKYLEKCVKLVLKEIRLLREKKLSNSKLSLAKQQLKGQIAIARESNVNLMLSNGKSLLQRGKLYPLKEMLVQLDKITAEELLDIANEQLQEQDLHQLIFTGSGNVQ
jgi:predicted Zn-dependent peptidase